MHEIRFHGRGVQGTVIGSKSLIKDFLLMRQIWYFAQIVNNITITFYICNVEDSREACADVQKLFQFPGKTI